MIEPAPRRPSLQSAAEWVIRVLKDESLPVLLCGRSALDYQGEHTGSVDIDLLVGADFQGAMSVLGAYVDRGDLFPSGAIVEGVHEYLVDGYTPVDVMDVSSVHPGAVQRAPHKGEQEAPVRFGGTGRFGHPRRVLRPRNHDRAPRVREQTQVRPDDEGPGSVGHVRRTDGRGRGEPAPEGARGPGEPGDGAAAARVSRTRQRVISPLDVREAEAGALTGRRARPGRAWLTYHIRIEFRVPLDFAFTWCTDFSPEDSRLEGESYQRKVVERTPRRVVFEDLEETDTGWVWSRDVVDLRPPDRWHMEGGGNRRAVVADYLLSFLPDGRTRLDLRWRRRPLVPESKPLTKAEREASTLRAWKRFRAAMEGDYRRSVRARRHRAKRRG